MICVAVEEKI